MTMIVSQCSLCTRFHRNNADGETCDAFPDGIPDEILWNEVDHRKPAEGDNGLRFEQREDRKDEPHPGPSPGDLHD